MRGWISSALIFVAVACADDPNSDSAGRGGGTNPTAVTGTVSGKGLFVISSFARRQRLVSSGSTTIYLSTRLGGCVPEMSEQSVANATTLLFEIPRAWPPPPGNYPIVTSIQSDQDGGSTAGAFAYLWSTDEACRLSGSDADATATAGSVTIEGAAPQSVTGRFEVTFRGGHLQGNFVATFCDVAISSDKACHP